jgi:hypothetical protein
MNKLIKSLALICIFAMTATCVFAQAAEPRDEVKANGYTQKALFRVVNDLLESANSRCFTDASASNNLPTSMAGIAATTTYTIDGIFYQVNGPVASITFSAGHISQPVLTACMYLFQIDAAGAFTSVQGPIVASTITPQMPRPTTGKCPVFAIKIVLSGSAVFVPGSTLMTATNVVETYYDLSVRPTSLKY